MLSDCRSFIRQIHRRCPDEQRLCMVADTVTSGCACANAARDLFSPHILDRAAFQLRPLKGPIAASEALRDKEGALHEELHLESTAPLVSPQLTPKVRVIRFADELEEPFAKRRLSRRGRFPTRRVERFVNHGSAL